MLNDYDVRVDIAVLRRKHCVNSDVLSAALPPVQVSKTYRLNTGIT
jgi:hypothetical protein